MPEDLVKRKNLWARLGNVKQLDWVKVAKNEGLNITAPSGGSSHTVTIRNPKINCNDPRSTIATVQVNMHKIANEKTFKKLRKFGIPEDNIWIGLGLL